MSILPSLYHFRDYYHAKLVDKTHINEVFDTSTIAVDRDYKLPGDDTNLNESLQYDHETSIMNDNTIEVKE